MRRIAAPPSPAMPTTAMPATSAPPNPESAGGSCRGVVRSEYVGSGVGDAAALSDGEDVGVGVTGVADVGDAEGRDEDSAAWGVDDGDGTGTAASVVVSPGSGACVVSGTDVASGVRVGLGEGFGDFVGVGAGSAMTSAHPRAG